MKVLIALILWGWLWVVCWPLAVLGETRGGQFGGLVA